MSFDYGNYFGEITLAHDLLTTPEERSWLLKPPRDGERHDVVLYLGCNVLRTSHMVQTATAVFDRLGIDYVAHANDEIVIMGMVETKEGLDNLDAICATPGLDAVYIGPSDLSFALGMAPRGDNPDPLHIATCDKIREAAHKAGIKACMHCASAAFAAGAVKRGFDLVMLTSDLASMVAGVRRQLDDLKAATA